MYYEINVSYKGTHFFATAPRSLTNQAECEKVLSVIAKKFTEAEGYEILVSRYEETGHHLTFDSKTFKLKESRN